VLDAEKKKQDQLVIFYTNKPRMFFFTINSCEMSPCVLATCIKYSVPNYTDVVGPQGLFEADEKKIG